MFARSTSVAAMLAAAVALAACGDDSSNDELEHAGERDDALPRAAATATTPATTTPADGDGGGEGVSEAGETLALGTRVVAPYVVYGKTGGSQQDTTLGVTVLRIRKGKISDFKDFNLDAKQKATVPYFVDVKYENLGKLKLQRFLLDPSIEDSDGPGVQAAEPHRPERHVQEVPEAEPRRACTPGQSFTLCAPFLLPKGKTSSACASRATSRKDPYFWK